MIDKINISCKDNKAYSPIGIMNLIRQAERENGGNLEAVLNNKHRYENLIEMYYGNFLALALYKKFGPKYKFNICQPEKDPPDLYFIQDQDTSAFPVEIMELYKHNDSFKSYEELTNHIWEKKGTKKYDKHYLLLASRLSSNKLNITNFVQELKKFQWDFQRIYLSLHAAGKERWTFFEVFSPPDQYNDKDYMYFDLNEDKKLYY